MSSRSAKDALSQRYSRAVRLTAPKLAAEAVGATVEGYWLNSSQFFFIAERFDSVRCRVIGTPSIADAESGRVHPVIGLDDLAALLSQSAGEVIVPESFASAEFDMSEPGILAVRLGKRGYLVDIQRGRVNATFAMLEVPALYSPGGSYACFVRGHDLWITHTDTSQERPLTTDGAPLHCYGQQSETNLSAVTYRKRPSPVGLWSPDGDWFLTHRIDERSVPELALIQHAPPDHGRPVLHRYKYALPGDPLPIATFVAIHVASGRTVAFTETPLQITSFSPFDFRRVWFDGPRKAWSMRLDRYCKQADLIELDLETGISRVVLTETAASGYLDLNPFLDASPNVRTLSRTREVVWFSERDGWGHLYLYDAVSGTLKNRITQGTWLVRNIVHLDEQRRRLFFLAGGLDPESDPAHRSLCSINLDGSGFQVLVTHEGDLCVPPNELSGSGQTRPFRPSNARVGISPTGRFGAVRYMSVDRGNHTDIVDLESRQGFSLAAARPGASDVRPRHFTALAADGSTRLHGVMFVPPEFDASHRYPLIDYIYPGPQIAWQPQSFLELKAAPALALAELGFITIVLNTRGMPLGSRADHQVGYGTLLEPQLADHAAVVRQLCQRHGFLDAQRVGMVGQSGGGSATARALCDYGDVFTVGVAVCGNHDSSTYAAIWSDKYRGPGGRESWADQANRAAAHKLNGKLLLISGDMDENVHVSHTLSLVDALVRSNRDFDLLIVPNEGHLLLLTNGYVQRRMWDYFVRNLMGETPPSNFEIHFEPHELERFARRFANE